MGENTKIEWTEATWNPWHGCHKVSQGCKNCYMFRDKKRYGQDPNVVVGSKTKFYDPLKWKEPRKIFTCSWSDFFIEEADPWRDEAMAIMALTPQHTYQVLTKRPDRMLKYVTTACGRIANLCMKLRQERNIRFPEAEFQTEPLGYGNPGATWYPLKNVWLGVSVEDRDTYITRVPYLSMTPATTKFLSFEPLLGDIGDLMLDGVFEGSYQWVIVGGESGPNARPMHPDWVRSIRDQCQATGVPFFFKQWGEWVALAGQEPGEDFARVHGHSKRKDFCFPINSPNCEQAATMYKVGKQKAGRILDGREWNEVPKS